MSDERNQAELELLRVQMRAYRERLVAIEARLAAGEARIDGHDGRLESAEAAIVDVVEARILFASVVEDMKRELRQLQREVGDRD